MIRAAIVLAAGLAPAAWPAGAETPPQDLFARACAERLDAIQDNYRICLIGQVEDERTVLVLYATRPEAIGKTVSVYESPVQQGFQKPLAGLSGLKGRIVVIGGFENGEQVYSARLL